ncbi:MAG: hypothetical protein M3Z64_05000 [Verrucomicrobiota bacterium]|nr:hypothetical protein [Verrucomicrobiota bacterium]
MRLPLSALLCSILSLALPAILIGAATSDRSVSTSRQFLVYGPDGQLRGAVSDVAERTKQSLLSTLREHDQWKLPIVLNAQFAQANLPEAAPALVSVSETEAGLKLQVDLALGKAVNVAGVQREILRALLLEMMYRDAPRLAPGSAYTEPPEWLLEGLLARQSGAEISRMIEPLVPLARADKLASLGEVLAQRPELLDPIAREIYRAYCAALVDLLSSSDNGARLSALIKDFAGEGEPVATLVGRFPILSGGQAGGEAAWRGALKHLLVADRNRLLTAAETEVEIERLLVLPIGTSARPAHYGLDEFPAFIRDPAAPAALQRTSAELLLLGTRVNLLYRPIVAEYQQIAAALAQRKTRGVAARLTRTKATRAQVAARTREMDDYLNWFEATQSRSQSGLFADYSLAAEEVANDRPPRRDAISVYLTALESELGN